MPNGTTLEETARDRRAGHAALDQPEVSTYRPTWAPPHVQFQRPGEHYYLRRVQHGRSAINLLPRTGGSCKARDLEAGAPAPGSRCQPLRGAHPVAEVPPGPPVLQTLWPRSTARRRASASPSRAAFAISGSAPMAWWMWTGSGRQPAGFRILVDKEKAALNGISEDDIARTMQVARPGTSRPAARGYRKEDVPSTCGQSRQPLRYRANGRLEGGGRTASWWRCANWCGSNRQL